MTSFEWYQYWVLVGALARHTGKARERKRKQPRKVIQFTFSGWHSCGHLINSLFKTAWVIKWGYILRVLGHHLIAGSSKLLNETLVVWKQLMNHLMNGTLVYLEEPKRPECVALSAWLIAGVLGALREIKITGNGKNQQSLSPYKFKYTQKAGEVPVPQNFKRSLDIL